MAAKPATARAEAPQTAAPAMKARASDRSAAAPRPAVAPVGQPVMRLVTGPRTEARVRDEGLDELLRSPGPGEPLPEGIRHRLEASLRVDLSPVRVHSDKRTQTIVDRLRARAFTFGKRIFLGSREIPSDVPLMAHEAAHVVQQRGRPVVVQMSTGAPSTTMLEREADSASTAVQRNAPASVVGRTREPIIQRAEPIGSIEQGPQAEEESSWTLDLLWDRLGENAARIREIIKVGMVKYLRDQIVGAFRALIDRLMAPVRPLINAMAFLRSEFTKLVGLMREVGGQLAKNDCSAITEGIQRVKEIADSVLTVIKEKIEAAWTKVKDFFTGLWDRFGAPIWETLKEIGGEIWEKIKEFGAWIWAKTATARKWVESAWTWLKNKLGIGEGEEGENGLLQWVQRKASEAWNQIKPIVEPYKKQLMIVAGIALLFTPAGPFVAFLAGVQAFRTAVQWFRENAQKKNAVVDQRSFVQRTLIPGVMKAVNAVTSGLRSAVGIVSEKLAGIVGGLAATAGDLKTSVVSFIAGAVEWIQTQVQALATWAQTQLAALADGVQTGLAKLKAFLQPVLDFLGEIGAVVVDIMKLPAVIIGTLWKKIPACIRDPFVNFLIEQVIKRIPLFKTVTETIPAIWTRIKNAAMTVIHKIFKEGDLPGALLEVLRLVLEALGIPLELFTSIFEKSGTLIDLIMEDPGQFLMNMFQAIKLGFVNFGKNILSHLVGGLKDWLFGAFEGAGLHPPEDFTLKSVFMFIIEVLGISVELVFQRLEKKFGTDKIKPFRKIYAVLSQVFSWIGTLMEGGPPAVWARLGEKLGDLWGAVLGAVQNYIFVQVAKKAAASLAQLAAAPVGTVIKAIGLIYDTIKAVVKYVKQLLEIVNGVLDMATDIAHGAVEGGAALIEGLLERALGVAIGFLAQYAGLGDLSERIREMVETLHEKVIAGIDWLIEKISAAIEKLIGLVKAGVGKLLEWWKKTKKVGDGEREHTLSFASEDSAEVMIESKPRTLETFIADTKGLPEYAATDKQTAIKACEKQIIIIHDNDDERTIRKNAGQDTTTCDTNISDAFDEIGKQLGIVLEGDKYGTVADPLELDWPGPATRDYPTLYFGGWLPPASRPKRQSAMKGTFTKGQKDETGTPIKPYFPEVPDTLPGGEPLGIQPRFRIYVGADNIGPLTTETTGGGEVLGNVLEKYGFSGEDDGMDIDHVREIQFGGLTQNNVPGNMWPLESGLNKSKGSILGGGTVEYPKTRQILMSDLKEVELQPSEKGKKFFFKVRRIVA